MKSYCVWGNDSIEFKRRHFSKFLGENTLSVLRPKKKGLCDELLPKKAKCYAFLSLFSFFFFFLFLFLFLFLFFFCFVFVFVFYVLFFVFCFCFCRFAVKFFFFFFIFFLATKKKKEKEKKKKTINKTKESQELGSARRAMWQKRVHIVMRANSWDKLFIFIFFSLPKGAQNRKLPTQISIFLDFWAQISRIAHPVNYSYLSPWFPLPQLL